MKGVLSKQWRVGEEEAVGSLLQEEAASEILGFVCHAYVGHGRLLKPVEENMYVLHNHHCIVSELFVLVVSFVFDFFFDRELVDDYDNEKNEETRRE